MENKEDVSLILESRAYNYLLFQSVFGSEPTAELVETLCGNATREALGLFSFETNASYEAALAPVLQALDSLQEDFDNKLDALRSEYTRLFVGPLELKAPPWESIYANKQRTLFQQSTLDVRNAYRAQGLLPAEYPSVADDHLALECAFLAQLGSRAQTACDNNDTEAVKTALDASKQFLEEHLLVWITDYSKDLSTAERADFYPLLAELALEFMKVDKTLLSELVLEL